MGLTSGAKVGLHAEMKFELGVLEPAPTTGSKVRWFGNVLDSEQSFVERDRFGFSTRRHRQLHVVKAIDGHGRRIGHRPIVERIDHMHMEEP